MEQQGKSKPRLVVLPFQPQEGQTYDGTGLAIHFLLGNIVAIHTGFKEFWFGWRVKKIFPEKEMLRAYCRGEGPRLDTTKIGKEQDIRYWLQGTIEQKGDKIQVFLELTDSKEEHIEWTTSQRISLQIFTKDFLHGWKQPVFP